MVSICTVTNPLKENFCVGTQKISLTHSHFPKRISLDMLPQPPVLLLYKNFIITYPWSYDVGRTL